MSDTPLRVAVIGGGIGGLAAANSLVSRGLDVHVYEQAPELTEVGAGVQLHPNAIRLLHRLGLGPALERYGAPIGPGSGYYYKDGSEVPGARRITTDSAGEYCILGMHRADVVDLLAAHLPEGVALTGHRAVGFEQDERAARVTFENGRTIEADVVVAADGTHSSMASYVVPPVPPVSSHMVGYRGLLSLDELPGWPNDQTEMWLGDGQHFLVFPVRAGTMVNYVGFVPTDEETAESWSAPGDVGKLRAAFEGWDPRIGMLLSKVQRTFWWGLYDREPHSRWTEGRMTLLGDAAHPMLPHLGQGANQAIEDGYALAMLLEDATPDSAPLRLVQYEELRRPRTSQVQRNARKDGNKFDSRVDDLKQRDKQLGEFALWAFDYDVEADVRGFVGA